MIKHACLVYHLNLCCLVSLCPLQKIRTTLDQERQNQKPGRNAFVLCILSHGGKGFIVGTDEEHITIDTITAMFDGESCPQLLNKPKIFFFQACRGSEYMFAPSSTSSERVLQLYFLMHI